MGAAADLKELPSSSLYKLRKIKTDGDRFVVETRIPSRTHAHLRVSFSSGGTVNDVNGERERHISFHNQTNSQRGDVREVRSDAWRHRQLFVSDIYMVLSLTQDFSSFPPLSSSRHDEKHPAADGTTKCFISVPLSS